MKTPKKKNVVNFHVLKFFSKLSCWPFFFAVPYLVSANEFLCDVFGIATCRQISASMNLAEQKIDPKIVAESTWNFGLGL